MRREIVFIDDDTLTPEELQMVSDGWEVDVISPDKAEETETEGNNEQQTEKQE